MLVTFNQPYPVHLAVDYVEQVLLSHLESLLAKPGDLWLFKLFMASNLFHGDPLDNLPLGGVGELTYTLYKLLKGVQEEVLGS